MIIGPAPVFLASLSLTAPLTGIARSIVAATAFSLRSLSGLCEAADISWTAYGSISVVLRECDLADQRRAMRPPMQTGTRAGVISATRCDSEVMTSYGRIIS